MRISRAPKKLAAMVPVMSRMAKLMSTPMPGMRKPNSASGRMTLRHEKQHLVERGDQEMQHPDGDAQRHPHQQAGNEIASHGQRWRRDAPSCALAVGANSFARLSVTSPAGALTSSSCPNLYSYSNSYQNSCSKLASPRGVGSWCRSRSSLLLSVPAAGLVSACSFRRLSFRRSAFLLPACCPIP